MPMITASTGASFSPGKSRGTALAKHDHLADARADAVHGDNRVQPGTELGRVLFIDKLRAQNEQLPAAHAGVLLGRYDRTFDFGEEHRSVVGCQLSVISAWYAPVIAAIRSDHWKLTTDYFFLGNTASTSACGRAMTWTLTSSL